MKRNKFVVILVLVVASLTNVASAQIESITWQDLPERVADKLLPLDELPLVDCPAGIEEAPEARTVLQ